MEISREELAVASAELTPEEFDDFEEQLDTDAKLSISIIQVKMKSGDSKWLERVSMVKRMRYGNSSDQVKNYTTKVRKASIACGLPPMTVKMLGGKAGYISYCPASPHSGTAQSGEEIVYKMLSKGIAVGRYSVEEAQDAMVNVMKDNGFEV